VPGLERIREVRVTKDVEDEEELRPQFIALPAVPRNEEKERSRGRELDNNDIKLEEYEEHLDIINCEFDCVTKFCPSDEEQCSDDCYQFCRIQN